VSEPSLGMLNEAVLDVTRRLAELEQRLGDSASRASPAAEGRLRQVESVLTEVREVVAQLAPKKASDDARTELRRPWHMLTAEQAEKRWIDLRAWVEFLVQRNNIGAKEIPDCWYLHGGLVDELEALRWAWLDANRPESKGTDPIWWRDALSRARIRWPLFNPNGCSRTHSEPTSRPFSDDRDWRSFLAEELADRAADRPARAS
jgi:hypothetical protein